jgi:hypothetical protein
MARYFLNCCGARKVFIAWGFILDEIPTVLQHVDLLCSMTPTRTFSAPLKITFICLLENIKEENIVNIDVHFGHLTG